MAKKKVQFLSTIPHLSEGEFEALRELIYKKSGIVLNEGKRDLIQSRLGKILRQQGIPSFKEYYHLVVNDYTGRELAQLLDVISTNVTHFFRENEHFNFLKSVVIPACDAKKSIKIWSAGCSSGEEPYCIAITLLETIKNIESWEIKVLATDISTRVLRKATIGAYQKSELAVLSKSLLHKYFQRGTSEWCDYYQIRPDVKKLIDFKRSNLLEPFMFKTKFNVIFCRNVMIYFDKTTREILINRFYKHLVSGGYLFVGHAESLIDLKHNFKYVKPAIYQKV